MYSALRPALAGPAAESPSTMSSSAVEAVRAAVGELVGHAGRSEAGRLALGLERLAWSSTRLTTAWAIFSRTALTWVFLPPPLDPLGRGRRLTTSYTIDCTAGVPSSPLGLALELRLGEGDLDAGDQALLHVGLLGAVLAVLARAWPASSVPASSTSLTTLVERPLEARRRACRPAGGDGVHEARRACVS